MFPHTVEVDLFPCCFDIHGIASTHVETVCLLSKLSDAKHHVEVELNLDEMDLTSAESKATYEKIKAYVQEHAGLNVSKLYIAQTKRKCGIIERENYNLPKNEDSVNPVPLRQQHQCCSLELCGDGDFDVFAEGLQKLDVDYVHPETEHSRGQRVVRFYDPDKHIIEVGGNMHVVCRCFLERRMTPEQVAKRMDMPVKFVKACM